MQRIRTPLALLLATAALAILAPTSTAVTLKRHIVIPHGVTRQDDLHRVVVTKVAPPDSDDDGCPNEKDSYDGPGCNAPEPVAPVVAESVAPAPVSTSVPTYSAGGCPSYMAAEATSPTAVNPTTGAAGCFQVLGSTADAMGAACADVNSSSCVAAICAAQGPTAWAASGANPCPYVEP